MNGRHGGGFPLVALLALAATTPGVAQTAAVPGSAPADTVRLGLADAVVLGLRVNERVEAARTQQDAADAQVMRARSGALPQLSLHMDYNRTFASVFDGMADLFDSGNGEEDGENPFATLPFGRPNTYVGSLRFSQLLYSGGRVGAALEIARSVRSTARLEVEEAEGELTLEVRAAYLQAVLAHELVAIAEEAYRLADEHLRQVESFRARGTASDFEVLTARVERDNLEPAVVEARNGRHLAELNLKRLLHIPREQPLVLTTPLAAEIAPVDVAALEAALARRPALLVLDEAVSIRENAVRVAWGERLPTVSLTGALGYQAFPDGFSPGGADWRRDWAVGVNVSLPLFTGQRIQGEVADAEAAVRRAALQRSEVRRGLELELSAALSEFESARAQIDARRATVEHAERALALAELRFENGMATQLEVSNARLALQQARVNEARALFNYLNALARLEQVTGGTVALVEPRLAPSDR